MIGEDNAPDETDKNQNFVAASISDFGRGFKYEAGFYPSHSPRPKCILSPLSVQRNIQKEKEREKNVHSEIQHRINSTDSETGRQG